MTSLLSPKPEAPKLTFTLNEVVVRLLGWTPQDLRYGKNLSSGLGSAGKARIDLEEPYKDVLDDRFREAQKIFELAVIACPDLKVADAVKAIIRPHVAEVELAKDYEFDILRELEKGAESQLKVDFQATRDRGQLCLHRQGIVRWIQENYEKDFFPASKGGSLAEGFGLQSKKRTIDYDGAEYPVDRSHPSPAASALDTIEWPLVVCDNELRLKHANRAGEIEIKSGRWLGMREERIILKAEGYAHTLEKLIASIIAPVAADRLHFPLLENGGRNAELWVRRLLRGSDQPGLVLISIIPELDLRPKSKNRDADESPARHLANLPLTARQRDLARHLLGGHNLTEAAQSMNISRATANGHLKALFDLSRTRRQSDLLCWLSRNLGV